MLIKNLRKYLDKKVNYRKNLKVKALRFLYYVKRAHNVYTSFFISLFNFLVITYSLFLTTFFNIPSNIVYFIAFALTFGLTYVLIAGLLGRWDIKKGQWKIESVLTWSENPIVQDIVKALYYIANDEKQKAIEILRKYVTS